MPVNIPDNLPATDILIEENIFVMTETAAIHQDIRALKIVVLNIMPVKIATETHILRQLSNSPIQTEITLMRTSSHESKNTPIEHLNSFYKTFDEIKDQKFDGLIITGAPVEHLEFEKVDYWSELTEILDWAEHHATSILHICWAAQAGLYYYYGVPKYPLPEKMFGIFSHTINNKRVHLVRGFDDKFTAPHSRHTEVRAEDIRKIAELEVISESDEAGVYIVISKDGKRIFVTGHSEYDAYTLRTEYLRDVNKGLAIDVPKHYFPNDDPSQEPVVNWRSHASLLYTNWLNYYVYQRTPYNIEDIR
jgi:homoserine O-succinyltransferase/O-acetyltransferase